MWIKELQMILTAFVIEQMQHFTVSCGPVRAPGP